MDSLNEWSMHISMAKFHRVVALWYPEPFIITIVVGHLQISTEQCVCVCVCMCVCVCVWGGGGAKLKFSSSFNYNVGKTK